MSVSGQKLPKWAVRVMSAFLPIATFERTALEVRFVPRAEVAPHSITSSASVSTFGGTAIPSCFAVLRFTTNQNLLAYLIGRSPGFAPLDNFGGIGARTPSGLAGPPGTRAG